MGLMKLKKILPIVIIGLLVISGLGVSGFDDDLEKNQIDIISDIKTINFSSLAINEDNDNYIELNFEETDSYLMEAGMPMLPKKINIFELPFGVKNVKVEVSLGVIKENSVTKEVRPSPQMLPLTTIEQTSDIKDVKNIETYSSNDPYPNTWYSYSVRSGLNKDNSDFCHCSFLSC